MNVYATDDQLQVIGHIYVLYDTRAEDKGIWYTTNDITETASASLSSMLLKH